MVLFNPTEDALLTGGLQATIDAINMAVVAFCSKPALAITPLPKEQMPKSTIGKLSRRKLKQSFEAGVFDKYRAQTKLLPAEEPEGENRGLTSLNLLSPMENK